MRQFPRRAPAPRSLRSAPRDRSCFFRWSLVSSCVSSVSKNQMSRGAFGFGTMITSSLSPAPSTTSITSSCAQCVSAPLTRTARIFLPQSRLRSASTAFLRAASFCAGATASSRSRNTMSAAVAIAFSIIFGLEAGVESSERLSRSVMIAPFARLKFPRQPAPAQYARPAAARAHKFPTACPSA